VLRHGRPRRDRAADRAVQRGRVRHRPDRGRVRDLRGSARVRRVRRRPLRGEPGGGRRVRTRLVPPPGYRPVARTGDDHEETTMRTHFAGVAALAAVLAPMNGQDQSGDRLAITRIVLYKHGVGYFEREGTVQGDATIPLTFKTAQMKDVLKSLFAIDLGGGRISTIHYDSKDPIQKQLEDILFRVPEGSALVQFLAQLKGADVLDASSIEVLDETVRRDLARLMDIYAKARYADRKTVHLRAVGE